MWPLTMPVRSLGANLVLVLCLSAVPGADLTGFLEAHDPSTILKCRDRSWTFATGRGIASSWSTNLIDWHRGPRVFDVAPSWAGEKIPGNRGFFWAPDIVKLTNGFHIYYSVSTWGSPVSAIGLGRPAFG